MSHTVAMTAIAPPTSRIVDLPDDYVSEAGSIQNLIEHECGGVGVILSKQGATRAGHYHKTDWHYLYVMHGSFVYLYRPVGVGLKPTRITVHQGQLLYTPPMEEHILWFREDTIMVSMSRLPRTHESHEDDVVRVEMEGVQ